MSGLLVVLDGALGDVVLRLPALAAVAAAQGPPRVWAPGRWCRLLEARGLAREARRVDAAELLPLRGPHPEQALPALGGARRALLLHEDEGLARGLGALGLGVRQLPASPPPGLHQALHALAVAAPEHGRPAPGGPEALDPPLAPEVRPPLALDALLLPGSGGAFKCWPLERFVALGLALRGRGWRVALGLGPVELERGWGEGLPGGLPVRAVPELEPTLHLLASAALVVGNDAGTSHLAAAVGTPTLTLFGPTPAWRWRPVGPVARVLEAASLQDLPVARVLDAALEAGGA